MRVVSITAMCGWGNGLVDAFATRYVGYNVSFVGSVMSAIWGFVDGFIADTVIAWVYNGAANTTA